MNEIASRVSHEPPTRVTMHLCRTCGYFKTYGSPGSHRIGGRAAKNCPGSTEPINYLIETSS